VQALAGPFFLLTLRALARHGGLDPMAPVSLLANSYQRLGTVTLMFLVSIPISFFTRYAYVCWIAIPLVGSLL
jgi:TMEM175 potassium channel family protein